MLFGHWFSTRAAGGIMIFWTREAFSPLPISILTIRRIVLFGEETELNWIRVLGEGSAVMHSSQHHPRHDIN